MEIKRGRLIDADALIKRLEDTAATPIPAWLKREIMDANTIEPAGAKWIKLHDCDPYQRKIYTVNVDEICMFFSGKTGSGYVTWVDLTSGVTITVTETSEEIRRKIGAET